jgi:hypothetical protein
VRRGIAYFLLGIAGFPFFYGVIYGYGWLLYDNLWRVLGGGVNLKALYSLENLPVAEMDLPWGHLIFFGSVSIFAVATLILTVSDRSLDDASLR